MTVDRCSICKEPAHASETDDFDRCAKCRRKGKRAKKVRVVDVIAEAPTGYRWLRQHATAAGAILLPDGRFQIIDEGKWNQALRAVGAVEIK